MRLLHFLKSFKPSTVSTPLTESQTYQENLLDSCGLEQPTNPSETHADSVTSKTLLENIQKGNDSNVLNESLSKRPSLLSRGLRKKVNKKSRANQDSLSLDNQTFETPSTGVLENAEAQVNTLVLGCCDQTVVVNNPESGENLPTQASTSPWRPLSPDLNLSSDDPEDQCAERRYPSMKRSTLPASWKKSHRNPRLYTTVSAFSSIDSEDTDDTLEPNEELDIEDDVSSIKDTLEKLRLDASPRFQYTQNKARSNPRKGKKSKATFRKATPILEYRELVTKQRGATGPSLANVLPNQDQTPITPTSNSEDPADDDKSQDEKPMNGDREDVQLGLEEIVSGSVDNQGQENDLLMIDSSEGLNTGNEENNATGDIVLSDSAPESAMDSTFSESKTSEVLLETIREVKILLVHRPENCNAQEQFDPLTESLKVAPWQRKSNLPKKESPSKPVFVGMRRIIKLRRYNLARKYSLSEAIPEGSLFCKSQSFPVFQSFRGMVNHKWELGPPGGKNKLVEMRAREKQWKAEEKIKKDEFRVEKRDECTAKRATVQALNQSNQYDALCDNLLRNRRREQRKGGNTTLSND